MMMMIVLCLLCSTDWLALAGGWLAVVSTHVSVWPGPGSLPAWQIHKTNLTSSFHNFRSHFILLLLLQSSHHGDAIFNIVLPYSVVMETREYYKSRVRVGMEDKPRWRRTRRPPSQQQHNNTQWWLWWWRWRWCYGCCYCWWWRRRWTDQKTDWCLYIMRT